MMVDDEEMQELKAAYVRLRDYRWTVTKNCKTSFTDSSTSATQMAPGNSNSGYRQSD